MAARGTKTSLAFGLVTCDVALYKTSGEEKGPAFEYAGPNGGRLTPKAAQGIPVPAAKAPVEDVKDDALSPEQKFSNIAAAEAVPDEPLYVEEGSGAEITKDERRRGLRRDDGKFVDLTEGLEEITDVTKLEEMRVADFIRVEQVQRERVIGSYFLAPDGPEAAKVIALMFEAMRRKKRAAVVKFTKRTKQSLAVLVPHPDSSSLMVLELAWFDDMRAVPERCLAVQQATISETEVAVAEEMVDAMSTTRAEALDSLSDDARRLTAELVETGGKVLVPVRPKVEEGTNVVDLMQRGLKDRDALKRSAA